MANKHPFERSGLAAVSDLQTPEWRELFALLENAQASFLEKETLFRSQEYKWPRDPLHWWSRVWEYAYVYYHLRQWVGMNDKARRFRTVDVGSGVTFFPFAVAGLGCQVCCTDIDPICKKDLERAINHVPVGPGVVEFRLTDGEKLPFADGESDGVYCISVLEHIPVFEKTINEISRILKPGGLFLLTVDLSLPCTEELNVKQYQALRAALEAKFIWHSPETGIHPGDMLHSWAEPHGGAFFSGAKLLRFAIKQGVLRPLSRWKSKFFLQSLAVQAFCLKRR